jgi:hypothetical protein
MQSGFYSTALVPAPESPAGIALADKRRALIADLGADPSEAHLALVDLVVAAWW